MPRPTSNENDATSLKCARVRYAIRSAVLAAVLADPEGVDALLDLTDEELGRRFKERLWEVAGLVTVFNIDLPAMRAEEEKLRKRVKSSSGHRPGATKGAAARSKRYQLLSEGAILREEDFIRASRITKKALDKDVASGRVFQVKLRSKPYYPAFFLSNMVDRKALASVVRRLRDTDGWSKWDFFTTPSESLGGSTPLRLLRVNELKSVLKAAEYFAKN
ncbi:hypothetical protein CBA19CS22_16300 [Caballeronia novacaledonica]|uniref:Uncharacterized protein n=2 Tax=Caballeronia novacaledonica TaxID=1544861 RepID=A0ACB5QTT1_9BURK|nr:hypothetical protein [Caballeronia novacaledonica]GJH18124.1 hypothetical protein CBA19CS22_16300 [Caballeronia novacaledonica]GJH25873.1 hypothetical protein CBA19CS42_15175 [Caballeronia novacaledonica]